MLIFILFSVLSNANVLGSQSDDSIKVFIDEKQISFDVEPMVVNGRTIVPLRAIFEALGAEVNWDDKTKMVLARHESDIIIIKVGSNIAYLNFEVIQLDVPAVIYEGRTLVPLRFISESFGYDVQWNASSRTVSINSRDSTPIVGPTPTPKTVPTSKILITSRIVPTPKPVSTPTPTAVVTPKSTPISIKAEDFNGNIERLMGVSVSDITRIFGQPSRIDLSRYGFDWYIYNKDYTKYIQIGIRNDAVVGVYTNSTNYSLSGGIKALSDKSSVYDILGEPLTYIRKERVLYTFNNSEEQEIFDVEGHFATVFYDIHDDNKVSSILLIEQKEEMSFSGQYGTPSVKLQQSYEREIFDLANSVRAKFGLKLFKWDDKAATSARKHSEDMAINNFFSHTNLKGKSPFDRMEDEGIKYSMAAENIATGQVSGIYAHEAWMNSLGHRLNILGKCEKLGVGVYMGGGYKVYYTQNFYTPFN